MYLCVCNLSGLLLQGMPHIKSYILNDIKAFKCGLWSEGPGTLCTYAQRVKVRVKFTLLF